MRVRINPHLADLAGSGLVLIGFLLAALALSAVPAIVQELTRRGPTTPPPAAAGVNGTARANA